MTLSDIYPRERGQNPTILTQPTRGDANPGGDIFGGWILSQMDIAGGAHAFAHVQSRVVTVGIDAMSFLRPVFVGDIVEFFTGIDRIGRTSIAIRIETWAGRGRGAAPQKVTEGLFTYVAIDAGHKPREIALRQGAV